MSFGYSMLEPYAAYAGLLAKMAEGQDSEVDFREKNVLGGLQDMRQGVSAPVKPTKLAGYTSADDAITNGDYAPVEDEIRMLNGPYGYEILDSRYMPGSQEYDRLRFPDQYPYSEMERYVRIPGEFAGRGE